MTIPPTLQVEITRLKTERDDARALLVICLPYLEDCAGDPAYKGAPVADIVRRIRAEVTA